MSYDSDGVNVNNEFILENLLQLTIDWHYSSQDVPIKECYLHFYLL